MRAHLTAAVMEWESGKLMAATAAFSGVSKIRILPRSQAELSPLALWVEDDYLCGGNDIGNGGGLL
jgi:hypothetical protein